LTASRRSWNSALTLLDIIQAPVQPAAGLAYKRTSQSRYFLALSAQATYLPLFVLNEIGAVLNSTRTPLVGWTATCVGASQIRRD
jgi:hypothetical protein